MKTRAESNAELRAEAFAEHGFVLRRGLLAGELPALESATQSLSQRAQQVLARTARDGVSLASFYRQHGDELIVVPEANNAAEVCRFEYMIHHSPVLAARIVPLLRRAIEELLGEPLVLFKDKCNLKRPGGGAFSPHQDATAYRHFGPQYHVTAAVAVDDATVDNGCVQMARSYHRAGQLAQQQAVLARGSFPLFPHHDGGPQNGDIREEVCRRLDWENIVAERGDVLVFDSFVPHRSEPNRTGGTRRMLFFTFNPAADGDWYQEYYRTKRADFDHPRFHVSTPTLHNALWQAS